MPDNRTPITTLQGLTDDEYKDIYWKTYAQEKAQTQAMIAIVERLDLLLKILEGDRNGSSIHTSP